MTLFTIYDSKEKNEYAYVKTTADEFKFALNDALNIIRKDAAYIDNDGDFYFEPYVLKEENLSENFDGFDMVRSENELRLIVEAYNEKGNEHDPYL